MQNRRPGSDANNSVLSNNKTTQPQTTYVPYKKDEASESSVSQPAQKLLGTVTEENAALKEKGDQPTAITKQLKEPVAALQSTLYQLQVEFPNAQHEAEPCDKQEKEPSAALNRQEQEAERSSLTQEQLDDIYYAFMGRLEDLKNIFSVLEKQQGEEGHNHHERMQKLLDTTRAFLQKLDDSIAATGNQVPINDKAQDAESEKDGSSDKTDLPYDGLSASSPKSTAAKEESKEPKIEPFTYQVANPDDSPAGHIVYGRFTELVIRTKYDTVIESGGGTVSIEDY